MAADSGSATPLKGANKGTPKLLRQPLSQTTSAASTPPSATSPSAVPHPPHVTIRPNTATSPASPSATFVPVNKMSMTSIVSQEPQGAASKVSMTSKEWVVPPRPKPGRKPATDTPPTKRKAQNRAAQRAFRERRAARVGELEDQIEEQREERDKVERDLRDKLHNLELDLESYRSRCSLLESLLDREREERLRAETEADSFRRKQNEANSSSRSQAGNLHGLHGQQPYLVGGGDCDNSQQPHALSSGDSNRPGGQGFTIAQMLSPAEPSDIDSSVALDGVGLTCGSCQPDGPCACAEEAMAQTVNGCGRCSAGTTCECMEETLKAMGTAQLKRPISPPNSLTMEKRQRRDRHPNITIDTDMAHEYHSQRHSASVLRSPDDISQPPHGSQTGKALPKNRCGLCDDGSYCVCADANLPLSPLEMPVGAHLTNGSHQAKPKAPILDNLPPPMEVTSTGAIKLRSPKVRHIEQSCQSTRGCGPNGPGTCAQCQDDPKSGLFCRSLAANFERQQGGCCGRGGGEGCCKANRRKADDHPLSLSCAETYKTLASHRNFDQAADDIGTWLPKLKAAPRAGEETSAPAAATSKRLPIEVEAASIMTVLKDFDVRFGE